MALDVLSEVLSTLELSSRPWFRAELRGPFAVSVPAADESEHGATIRFHVATGGNCTVSVAGRNPIDLAAGDLILVPHGSAHVIADQAGREPIRLDQLTGAAGVDGIGPLLHGEGPDCTTVVCGEFAFGSLALHPFLASLPPELHLRADATTNYGWVEQVMRHLENEARQRRTGHLEVIRRLSEILLIEVLRIRTAGTELGALGALADPQMLRALEAIHETPADGWSLDRLARVAGQSRTRFAATFRDRVGMPPMKYLATWRMQKARGLLTQTASSVGEIAQRVGYSSESAFNRAFREQFGSPPGAWRKARTGA